MKRGDLVRLREQDLNILGDRFRNQNAFIVINMKPTPARFQGNRFRQNIEVLAPDGNLLILLSDFFEVIDEAG